VVLGPKEIHQLPDDPDDLLQELQILAASRERNPAAAVVVADTTDGQVLVNACRTFLAACSDRGKYRAQTSNAQSGL
jgi:hypothetical protein